MTDHDEDLTKILELATTRASAVVFEGYGKEDRNFPGNLLVVVSPEVMYSFEQQDIVDREDLAGKRVRVWIRDGAKGFRTVRSVTGEQPAVPFEIGMEDRVPPAALEIPGMPSRAFGSASAVAMENVAAPRPFDLPGAPAAADLGSPPLSAIAAHWMNSCAGGDVQSNNCAHYLSDAFIRAGFTELAQANPHIEARCGTTARRPIRARNMWSWFQSKATTTSTTARQNTGWWAVFQLDERAYWGGHVAVLDSNAWQFYGTGWYANWNQYLYQW